MRFTYYQFCQIGSEQWLVQPSLPRRIYVRLFGPLGINARIRSARIIRNITRLNLPRDSSILDFGCGHSYAVFWLAKQYPDYYLTAIDINPNLIREGQIISDKFGLKNTCFIEGSIDKVNNDSNFDLIFSSDVLEHIKEDVSVLETFRQALKPNGHLLLHLPLRHQLSSQIIPAFKSFRTIDHVREEYTPAEISAKLNQVGFVVQTLEFGYSKWGELAFELNYLFWNKPLLRVFFAILTHPISKWLAFMDVQQDYKEGNSIILHAKAS